MKITLHMEQTPSLRVHLEFESFSLCLPNIFEKQNMDDMYPAASES
jgi:hypothetical protein